MQDAKMFCICMKKSIIYVKIKRKIKGCYFFWSILKFKAKTLILLNKRYYLLIYTIVIIYRQK